MIKYIFYKHYIILVPNRPIRGYNLVLESDPKTSTGIIGFQRSVMFRFMLKMSFRNLLRNGKFSLINILGLAIGISTCLAILLFIANERSYDRFNLQADRMVRVVFRGEVGGQQLREANVMPPVAQALKADYPEVQDATRLVEAGSAIVVQGAHSFKEDQFCFVDPNFFEIFTLPLLEGNPRTALDEPNTVVITRDIAQKYFGSQDPIGKILTLKDHGVSMKVTGVMNPVPKQSHFHFSFFASMKGYPDAQSPSYMTSDYYTYLLLAKGYDYRKLQAKLPGFLNRHLGPQMEQAMGMSLEQFRKGGNQIGLFLQPLLDIHLHSDFTNDLSPEGDIRYLYIFGAIGLFMLLIACINFMNLSTAGASKRMKEVGVRKVLGSARSQLTVRFLLESILITAMAMILGLCLLYAGLPYLEQLSGKTFVFSQASLPWAIPGLILLTLVTGLVAGSYPAFFLSSFKPVTVLKGKSVPGKKSLGLRSSLVVFQFFISITLIISTLVVYKQMRFIQGAKLGYDKNQVLVVPNAYLLGKNQEAFFNELKTDPNIINVSESGYLPAGPSYNNNFFVYPDHREKTLVKTLRYDVDYDYIPTLGIQLSAGRNFSRQFGTDSTAAVVNQSASAAMGWGQDALGHTLTRRDNDGKEIAYRVIGVVHDFHFKSLHELISPLVMVLGSGAGTLILKVKNSGLKTLNLDLTRKWNALHPEAPFSDYFLDSQVRQTYDVERRTGILVGIFAFLAILVGCMGLFGLVLFEAEQRMKEIGIRKVLGAQVHDIVAMLSRDYLRLILWAILLASPSAWWIMNKWLQGFAYQTTLNWWVFFLAGMVAVLIAGFTIGYHALQAARTNPVNNLRTE